MTRKYVENQTVYKHFWNKSCLLRKYQTVVDFEFAQLGIFIRWDLVLDMWICVSLNMFATFKSKIHRFLHSCQYFSIFFHHIGFHFKKCSPCFYGHHSRATFFLHCTCPNYCPMPIIFCIAVSFFLTVNFPVQSSFPPTAKLKAWKMNPEKVKNWKTKKLVFFIGILTFWRSDVLSDLEFQIKNQLHAKLVSIKFKTRFGVNFKRTNFQ